MVTYKIQKGNCNKDAIHFFCSTGEDLMLVEMVMMVVYKFN